MEKLIFATHNTHKLGEVAALLEGVCQILSPGDLGLHIPPEETATTLEGNALLKARHLYALTGQACFADDTGLEVRVLNGAPGVYSARYGGEEHNDACNRAHLLAQLESKPKPWNARFRTAIAYIDSNGQEHLFEGIVEGEILPEERGKGGFGYDALFRPKDCNKTFAEMSPATKNELSHRARAIEALKQFLLSSC